MYSLVLSSTALMEPTASATIANVARSTASSRTAAACSVPTSNASASILTPSNVISAARLPSINGYGVTLSPYPLIDGSRAADITFEGVRIDADALLVGTEHAAAVLDEAVDRATLAIVAEAVGSMSAVLESTSEYIKNRVQFGQPLGKFQSLQHRMAEAFVELQESRSMLYRGMAYLDGSVQARR